MTNENGQNRPPLSVVLPTYNDARCLELTLRSLSRQTLPTDLFEIVIVMDGVKYDSLEDHIKGLPVTVVERSTRGGRSVARNEGLRHANGPIILLLDSDSYADPDLLRRHYVAHQQSTEPRVVLGKRYEIDWPHVSHIIRDEEIPAELLAIPQYGDMRWPEDVSAATIAESMKTPWLYANTNNISAPAEALTGAGGFDERFGTKWGWEDTEAFYRVYDYMGRSDETFVYDEQAIVYHLPHYRDHVAWLSEFVANRPLVKKMHPHMDWEFQGFRMPDVLNAKIRHHRQIISECQEMGACRLPDLWDWIAPRLAARGAERVLWNATDTDQVPIGDQAWTFDYSRPVSERNFHVVGTVMPLPDGQVDAVVSIDFWRQLPWIDLCDFLRESTRVAPLALLMYTGNDVPGQLVASSAEVDYVSAVLAPYFTVTPEHDGTTTGLWVRRKVT